MKNKKIFGIVVGIIVIIIAVVFIKDKTGKQTVKDENNTTTVETTVIETTTETNTESVQKATVAGEKGTVADNSKNTVLPTRMEAVVQRLMKRQQLRNQVRKQRRQQRITIVRTANLQTIHMEVMDLEIIMLWIYLAMSLKQQRRTHLKQKKPQLQRRIIQEIPIRMTMVGQISINMVN